MKMFVVEIRNTDTSKHTYATSSSTSILDGTETIEFALLYKTKAVADKRVKSLLEWQQLHCYTIPEIAGREPNMLHKPYTFHILEVDVGVTIVGEAK